MNGELNINELAEELNSYAELCNDEYGEMCTSLAGLLLNWGTISDEMLSHLVKYAVKQLEYFKSNCTLETKEEPCTSRWVELVWKDE